MPSFSFSLPFYVGGDSAGDTLEPGLEREYSGPAPKYCRFRGILSTSQSTGAFATFHDVGG